MKNTNRINKPTQSRWWRPHSIRGRMILYFSVLYITIIGLSISISFYGVPFTSITGKIEGQRQKNILNLGLLADSKKEILTRWLDEKRSDTRLIANTIPDVPSIINLQEVWRSSSGRGVTETEFLDKLRQNPDFLLLSETLNKIILAHLDFGKIEIADVETGIVVYSEEEGMLGSDLSLFNSFQQARMAYDVVISEVHFDPIDHIYTLSFMHPIFDEGGKRVAILILSTNIENVLLPLLHTGGGLGLNGEVVLVNNNQVIIANLKHSLPDGTVAQPLEYRITAKPAMLAATGNEGVIESKDYRNQPVLAAYRYIPVTHDEGWGMVVKLDVQDLNAPLQEDAMLNLLVTSIGGLLIIPLTIAIASGITRPLQLLSETVDKISNGNFEVRTRVVSEDEVGQLTSVFNIMLDRIRDITADLVAANEEMEAFAYSVSHDLRAPLRAISGFTQVLMEDYANELDDAGKGYLGRVTAASQRMASLIDDLLRLSRIGRKELQYSDVNLSEIGRSIARELSASEPNRQVTFVIADDLKTKGDKPLLKLALENLIGNAWKFTQKNAQARIEFGCDDQLPTRVYYIRDNGAGFDMAYEDKLFSPFQRLHPTDEFKGTGIGLAFIQRIILRHGGKIWAEAEVDKGATFFFTLGL